MDLRSIRFEIIYTTLAQVRNCLVKAIDLLVKITQFEKNSSVSDISKKKSSLYQRIIYYF